MNLSDLKVVVTGAAGGMGRHFAAQLKAAGAQVAAGDIAEDALATLSDRGTHSDAGGRIHTHRLDVANEQSIVQFVDWADETLGGVNALINNAAVIRDGLLVKRDRRSGEVVKLSNDKWFDVLDVNLTGATFMVREVVAKMIEQDRRPGVIVNMSSVSRLGNRGQSSYVASKAALAANTTTWMKEFAPYGIRVGAVSPGVVETPMTQGMNQAARDAMVARIPVGRIGLPADLWMAVRFVLECDYFNGRTIDVDGGMDL